MTVNKDKRLDKNHATSEAQPIEGLKEYYKSITKEDNRLGITSDCIANMINKDLKDSIHVEYYATEINLDTVTENINENIKGEQHIPTKNEIMKSSTFG